MLAFALAAWELYGRLVSDSWVSRPLLIFQRMAQLVMGRMGNDVIVTLAEIGLGFVLGLPAAVVMGLWLGRNARAEALLRPVIVTLNAIPLVALAPLLIMWFGLGISSKVALVALAVFFVVFFSTMSGSKSVDNDWLEMLSLMGATRYERFAKVTAPASVAWIMSGVRAALPYSLIAATVGEMMLSRAGVGNYIVTSASQFDMTGVYTGLLVLMVLGAVFSEAARLLEGRLLSWRAPAV